MDSLQVYSPFERYIGRTRVVVRGENITSVPAEAYIVPEFRTPDGGGGLRRFMKSLPGAAEDFRRFDEEIRHAPAVWGEAIALPSEGSGPSFIHVICKTENEGEYGRVRMGFYNALKLAAERNIRTIVAPVLGAAYSLTETQSANAMMSAVQDYDREGNPPLQVNIAGDRAACKAFTEVLTWEAYRHAPKQAHGEQVRSKFAKDVRPFLEKLQSLPDRSAKNGEDPTGLGR